jgi:hypothetical protein
MNKVLGAAAFSALAIVGLAGPAQAECYWGGNHWNCPGGTVIYPKSYPPDTILSNGVYSRPMAPSQADIDAATRPSPPQR